MNQDQRKIYLKRLMEANDESDRYLRSARDEYRAAKELATAVRSGKIKMASIGSIRTLMSKPDALEIYRDEGALTVHFKNYRIPAEGFFDKASLDKVKVRIRKDEAAHVQKYQNLRDGLKDAFMKAQIEILDKNCTPEAAEQLLEKIKAFGTE